jgi:hypothetical protein
MISGVRCIIRSVRSLLNGSHFRNFYFLWLLGRLGDFSLLNFTDIYWLGFTLVKFDMSHCSSRLILRRLEDQISFGYIDEIYKNLEIRHSKDVNLTRPTASSVLRLFEHNFSRVDL